MLTWSDYLDPELVAAFEADSGYKLRFTYFESDETRDDYLIRNDGRGYDLILSNGYALDIYRQRGWLQPVTAAQVPNFKHIDKQWLQAPDAAAQFGVPYFWGTLGIAYRSDLLSKPLTRWMDIYAPAPELHGKIIMINHSRDLLGMGLRALGYSANSADPRQLDAVRELLLKQKPYVSAYSYIALTEDSALLNGAVLAAQIYSGDALMLKELNPDIEYVVPEEGTNLWVDYWLVAAQANNAQGAHAFLDYINEPQNAARNALFVHYASPNGAANRLLPQSHLSDPVINPDQRVLDSGEKYLQLPPRTMRIWNEIFSAVVN